MRVLSSWQAFLLLAAGAVPALAAGTPARHAAKPAAPAGARADSAIHESPPAPFIVTPTAPPATLPPAVAEDTALAGAKRRAMDAYRRAAALERTRAYAAAIVSYQTAARTDPSLRGPCYRIGLLYASRQQYDPAARAFREEMHRDPDNPAPATQYALMLSELGDTTRPVRMLQELTRRAPTDAAVWRALGVAYARVHRTDEADHALRGAVALDATYAEAWRDLGVLLADRGDATGARDAYQHAIRSDPDDVTALVNLANLESRSGDHARALARFAEVEHRDSAFADGYRGQIRELVLLGREPDAGAVWRRWLGRVPDDHDVREGAARHFVRQGRADVALEIARDGVRRSPGSGQARWLLGEMSVAAQDTLGALTAYRAAARRYRAPADRARAEADIARLRAAAPESLRARFAADSLESALADTTRRPGR